MTVDTVVKIVESEKCGLDMSSYEDLHSSVANVGGNGHLNGGDDCNGEGKDDYVFVNGSDVALSDDHRENHESGEVNVDKLSVEGGDNVKVNGDVERDGVENGDKVDAEESKVENSAAVGEGGGLVEENREIKFEGKVVEVEDGVRDSNIEGEVDVSAGISEVNEGSHLEPVVDGVQEESVPEPVVDEVKEESVPEPVVDEVKEESVPDPVVDEVKEESVPGPVVDEVREESVPEPVVDEVKEESVPEPVVDEVKEESVPVVDEVKEESVPEPVVDEVTEISDAKSVVDGEVQENSDQESVVDEAKEVELGFEIGDNGNVSGDGIAFDDNSKNSVSDSEGLAVVESEDNSAVNSVPDAPEPSEAETQTDTTAVEVPKGELEPDTVSPLENEIEIQGIKPDSRLEDQAGKPEVTENNGDVHGEVPVTEFESADSLVTESKALETNVSDQAHNGLAEEQPLDDDFKASLPQDAEGKGLPSDDATSAEHSSECQQQNSPSVDGEDEKQNIIEVEVKIDEQGDTDLVATAGSQESVDSEAAVCDQDQGEKDEITDQIGSASAAEPEETPNLDSFPRQPEEVQIQGNLEFADTVVENPVSVTVGQSDTSNIESSSGVEENGGAISADMQFNITDKSVAEDELKRVDVDIESELMAETRGSDISPVDGVLEEQVAEQTVSSDLVDKEISSEDISSVNTSKAEDTTNLLNLQSADDTSTDVNQNAQGGSHASEEGISENKVVSALDESSEDAGSCVRSEDNHLDSAELAAPSDTDVLNERGVANDTSSVADNASNGSVDDSSLQIKLANSNGPVPDVHDSKLETKPVNSEIDVAIKSNNFSDGTVKPKISFGSFDCESPLSHNDINLRSDTLDKSAVVSISSSECKLHAANGVHSSTLNHDTAFAEVAPVEQSNEISAEADSLDGHNINPDLVRRPFYWLIKIPKADDEKYKEQKRQIDIEVAEKTKTRDAFQAEFNKQQARSRELSGNYEAARSEVKTLLESLWAKKRELDAANSLLNLAKYGTTTEDIDSKIRSREHKIQHETLSLKEEKELVREIKQLNLDRQKICSNPQKQQEVQQALNQKAETEEKQKVLKKEMDALREKISKAEEHVRAAKKRVDEEAPLLNNLSHQLKSANEIRQKAFIHSKILQRQQIEKEVPFYKVRNDIRIAYNYAAAGNKESLERYCLNQVEKVMELWNRDDEFRKEYIQSNRGHMLRKLGTLDGTQLGINEVRPPMGDVSVNRVRPSAKVNSSTAVLTLERELPVEDQPTEDKSVKKVEQKKVDPIAKKNEGISVSGLANSSDRVETEEDTEEPTKLTKEEEELAMKAEQLRKEEEAAQLREQRRLEEKAKAEEALERKRRNAIKAQARAEFKARKEAEQKEKERERRAKKKEKKKGVVPEITEKELAQSSEPLSESVKEPGVTEKPATTGKRPQKVSLHTKQIKTTKPIPPALRNKGKRGLLRYWPYAFIVLLALALFYLGSVERIQTIKQHLSGLLHW